MGLGDFLRISNATIAASKQAKARRCDIIIRTLGLQQNWTVWATNFWSRNSTATQTIVFEKFDEIDAKDFPIIVLGNNPDKDECRMPTFIMLPQDRKSFQSHFLIEKIRARLAILGY